MSGERKKVLLADDSGTVRRLLTLALRPLDLEILEAADGRIALSMLEHDRIDVAIVDLNMPGMDGIELIRALRSRPEHKDLPILMLTTESRDTDIQMAYQAGANLCLSKPCTPAEIRGKVTALLGLA